MRAAFVIRRWALWQRPRPDSACVGEDANEYGYARQEAVVPLPRGAIDGSHYLPDDDRHITSYMVRCVNMLAAI
jgi:hypothetical protein